MAIQFDNSNTGTVTLKPGASGSYSLVLPTALPGVAGYVLSSDLSGNLSWTVNGSGGSMVYPGAGIPNSTGSAWGTSYTTTGSGTVVALQTQPSFTTDIRTPKVTTASAVNLVLDTNAGTTTGSIIINTGANGAISIAPNGTGSTLIGGNSSNYFTLSGAASGSGPTIASTGAVDANVNVNVQTKGTGSFVVASTTTNTTSNITASGANANINLVLAGKGTGTVVANTLVISTAGAVTTGTWQATAVGVAYGGTGQTSYVNGELLIGNTTGNTLTKATLTQGTGITITNGTGSITIANAGVTAITTSSGLSANTNATGSVSITNTGVTSFTSSSGLSANTSATGAVSVTNTAPMVYPGSGIANSTGSAWGTSYSTTGSSTVVALGTSPSFTTDIRTPKVTTASTVNLVLDTNAGTSTGNITINTGVNADIAVTPNGTGNVKLGDTTASGVITTGAATANLTLSTNNGTTSGSIVITAGANGNITITPNGTGVIDLGANTAVKITGGTNGYVLSTNGSGVLSWIAPPSSMVYPASGIANSTGSAWGTSYSTTGSSTVVALGTSPSFTTDIRTPKVTTSGATNLVLETNTGTNSGTITLTQGTNGNIILLPNGSGQVLIGSTTSGILNIQGASASGTATITTNVTTGAVSLMTGLTTATMTIGSANTGRVAIAFNQASTSTTTGALTVAGGVGISGALNATTKSFIIKHPTKTGKLLRHGSLEGPEFGVYVRGRLTDSRIINLPEYWTGLVDVDSITVDLTPIGKFQKLYVEKIEGNQIYIDNDAVFGGNVSCFYTVWATRKDVDKLEVEGDE